MSSKGTVLITGANKGIGFEVARQLGTKGFSVWLGCRDKSRGEAAVEKLSSEGIVAKFVEIDVQNPATIQTAATQLDESIPALNVLINNAGMHFGYPPPASREPIDQISQMFDINCLGSLRVTQAFLPLLRKSSSGASIVMVTSGLGSIGESLDMRSESWTVGFAGYSAAKAALNMVTVKLAKELSVEGIKVNAADPGLTATDLTGDMGYTVQEGATIIVKLANLGALGPTAGFVYADEMGSLRQHIW